MNVMSFGDYCARIEYSEDDGCYIGHLAGIRDVVGFHGDTVANLRCSAQFSQIQQSIARVCISQTRALSNLSPLRNQRCIATHCRRVDRQGTLGNKTMQIVRAASFRASAA